MTTVRLTMAQALARFLTRQMTVVDGEKLPIVAGIWAIFGHGNVAGMGEALYGVRDELPTYRAHNEQAMAHAATAFAKANFRRRFMACTTSIGPGATNMVTAAAVAHVNRLPLLLLPGDVFASRRPDPVLQQIEDFGDATVSANDCFRPVSRYFDRLTRPEQLMPALHRAMAVLTDPAECGPVTLGLCQDVQAEAYDYPASFFAERIWATRRPRADEAELQAAAICLRNAHRPVIIAGGGVLYSEATEDLLAFAHAHDVPVLETQAGKSSMPHDDPLAMGSVGVTGTSVSNRLAGEADVILAVGTRLQDFTTGSWTLFQNPARRIVGLNVQPFDALKHATHGLVADARAGLSDLSAALGDWCAPAGWRQSAEDGRADWNRAAAAAKAPTNAARPSDAAVIGAVERVFGHAACVVCAAGGLPGELHKLWNPSVPGGYHLEYGFSCMGYEIAGGLGVKLARPDDDVVVMVGDGSYLMMNSEIATSVMLGLKLVIVVLDNRGYGCINRLQRSTGAEGFNNLLGDSHHLALPEIDFAAHARALGAIASKVGSIADLEAALTAARDNDRTTVVVIDTDAYAVTEAGGTWWDVAVPEVSTRGAVNEARASYEKQRLLQRAD
ncbi:3D-(3,5/4)-trihydroxycyclohexane-1,2-dione acylhydrolase (decyclizing) [Aureimonas glaciei]|uniref:3D-(3,5/4)-trihydroxycyclohexane-1,2-dione acylhydrolase (Decyclizing) n=1 Tax=Aureimonas glaciei TaxID=1776957 RepID=A0A917D951_9HYPH|nr:3D-(3,5/4)-trihydroxycyclohexane-1,2-dione acylhydrolase (decyclizing) [Aureimonas glaciei]GGD11584.1 3D-(3,5/4)-trihydroxycyclohexane-1,2-dione acylhydrolase (decyclizing) [Aureimonas glaciei]